MQAKHHERAEARRLRAEGRSLNEIAAALGVSKSSASVWVRDLPKPPRSISTSEQARRAAEARWVPRRRRGDAEREATMAAARAEVDQLSVRDLLLVGAALYWAEGTKSKPYRRSEHVTFINSDPDMIKVFLAWLELVGTERDRLIFRVCIHESADVESAQRFWAEIVGVPAEELQRPTLKRHNPRTVRKNVGDDYRGCLRIDVRRSAELYRRIEGWWCGIVGGARSPGVPGGGDPSRIV